MAVGAWLFGGPRGGRWRLLGVSWLRGPRVALLWPPCAGGHRLGSLLSGWPREVLVAASWMHVGMRSLLQRVPDSSSSPSPYYPPPHHKRPTKVATVALVAAPQGAARSRRGPFDTPLRWASQEPTKVAKMAIVAQFAAPQGAARSRLDLRVPPLRWASQEPTKVATVVQFAAPQGAARQQETEGRRRWKGGGGRRTETAVLYSKRENPTQEGWEITLATYSTLIRAVGQTC